LGKKRFLRIATYELVARIDVPYKVGLMKPFELAKIFLVPKKAQVYQMCISKAIKTLRKDETFGLTPKFKEAVYRFLFIPSLKSCKSERNSRIIDRFFKSAKSQT